MNRSLASTLFATALSVFSSTAGAAAIEKQAVLGRWAVESVTSSDPRVQGLPIKTKGHAALQADGSGDISIVAKMGFLSQTKSTQFTWKLDDHELHVYDVVKAKSAVWKLVSVDAKRMEAEVPTNSQTLRIVFVKA